MANFSATETVIPNLDIRLTDELASYVAAEVDAGRSSSANALVSESLSMFQRDRALEAEKIVLLRQAVEVGLADVAAGRVHASPRKTSPRT